MKELKLEELVDLQYSHILIEREGKFLCTENLIDKDGSLFTRFSVGFNKEWHYFETLPKAIEYFNI